MTQREGEDTDRGMEDGTEGVCERGHGKENKGGEGGRDGICKGGMQEWTRREKGRERERVRESHGWWEEGAFKNSEREQDHLGWAWIVGRKVGRECLGI